MPTLTDVEKVTLLHIAHHCDKRGEDSYARIVRQMVQRLAPDVRIADKAAEIDGAFGHIKPLTVGVAVCPVCHGDCSCIYRMP